MGAAAIYVRQSEDKTGHAAAVGRQEQDCRLLAAAKGWEDPVVYSDNSISATSGKTRPGFEQLLRDIESGAVDRVAVWHLDRLTRSMRDLTRIIEVGKSSRVNIASVHGVSLDLGDPTGVAVAQILTAIAAMETAHKGERQARANRQRAEAGTAFWTRRPFGYDRDESGRVVVVKPEAKAIRAAAKSVLAGATLASVARSWNEAGLWTTYSKRNAGTGLQEAGGKPWGVTQVRRVLLNPRYAGRRLYKGDDMGKGNWKAILTPTVQQDLERKLTDPGRRSAPDDLGAKYLLSGIAVCGRCGKPMFASPMKGRGREWMVYRCYGGYCLARRLDLVDEVVEHAVVARLARPDVAAALQSSGDVTELRKLVTEKRKQRDTLAQMLTEKIMSPTAVRQEAGKLTAQITALEADIARATATDPLADIVAAEDVAARWAGTPLEDRRKILRTLVDVAIMPAGKGTRFSPKQVQIMWKGDAAAA